MQPDLDELERLATEPLLSNGIPKPDDEDLDGSLVLDAVCAYLGRFVSYPSVHAQIAHTLWVAHTHLMGVWESTPRLAALSPEPGSGKTRLLEITETLVPRPMQSINATAAALFRTVSSPDGPPTILYDEIDTIFGPRAREHEDARAFINAGHRKGALAHRCVVKGKQIELEEFPCYCAVALAGLGNLPDTILTRSIVIRMRRRAPTEKVEAYRRRLHAPEGNAIRDRLADWATAIRPHLNLDIAMPPGIEDRNGDCWESLLAIADAAGGPWPERAKVAAVDLVEASKGDRGSLGIRLLRDLRIVFGNQSRLWTDDILAALVALDEAPWSDLKGKAITATKLADLLRSYGVKSKQLKIEGLNHKGYEREDFSDAWMRYLPQEGQDVDPAPPSSPVKGSIPSTSSTPDDESVPSSPIEHVTSVMDDPTEEGEKSVTLSPLDAATGSTSATPKHENAKGNGQDHELRGNNGAVHTVNGKVVGGLLVHRTLAVPGYTVTHAASGLAVATRLPSKEDAERRRTALLESFPSVDWTTDNPMCDPQTRTAVKEYVAALPIKITKPLRAVAPEPDRLSPVMAAWTTRHAGLDGNHDLPMTATTTTPCTPAQQARLDRFLSHVTTTFPPVPVGALITYRRDGRVRGGPDEPEEGRVVGATYDEAEDNWHFCLANGLIVTARQVVGVTTLRAPDAGTLPPSDLPGIDPRLWYWIQERHAIYVKRRAGHLQPWTDDPILRTGHFCNVYRELDRETQWIAANWRTPHADDPHLWFAMCVARLVNWNPTLADLGYPVPWNAEHFVLALQRRKANGDKVFSDAYTICPRGSSNDKVVNVASLLTRLWAQRETVAPTRMDTLRSFCDRLRRINGMGGFYAGQVVADLKYVAPLRQASDWMTFAVMGPGSARGLNRVLGRPTTQNWSEPAWFAALTTLHRSVTPLVEAAGLPALHAQDLQNCLCETDKYLRATNQEGRLRGYHANEVRHHGDGDKGRSASATASKLQGGL